MDDDNNPRLSPLWHGRRKPFRRLMLTLFAIGRAYDIRNGDTTTERFRLAVLDTNGQPITGSYSLPIDALDDLQLALEDIRTRRRQENKAQGHMLQHVADSDLARMDKLIARGKNADDIRAGARANYAEAAHRTAQPDDLDQLTTPGPAYPKEN